MIFLQALLVSDFGPRISMKIVDSLREDIMAGKLKSGAEIKEALKRSVLDLLTSKGKKTELQLGFRYSILFLFAFIVFVVSISCFDCGEFWL